MDPNSENLVAEFLRQKEVYYGTVTINTYAYASPVYVVEADVMPVPVTFWDCQNKGYREVDLEAQWSAVLIPEYAEQADGTDGEMTIYQPSTKAFRGIV